MYVFDNNSLRVICESYYPARFPSLWEKFDKLVPIIKEYDASVIALAMDERGMLDDSDEVLKIAEKLVQNLNTAGIGNDKIFVDPLIKPISTNSQYGLDAMNATKKITTEFPGIHLTCGLSNVSFGLPKRKLINQAFMMLMMANGMDSAIIDPLDKRMMALVMAAETLLGKDEFAMNYLTADREGKLEDVV